LWLLAILTVSDEHFPSIRWHLELIKIEGNQVIHEEAFDLTAEYVDFRAENI
jgi:hypothetical protein